MSRDTNKLQSAVKARSEIPYRSLEKRLSCGVQKIGRVSGTVVFQRNGSLDAAIVPPKPLHIHGGFNEKNGAKHCWNGCVIEGKMAVFEMRVCARFFLVMMRFRFGGVVNDGFCRR